MRIGQCLLHSGAKGFECRLCLHLDGFEYLKVQLVCQGNWGKQLPALQDKGKGGQVERRTIKRKGMGVNDMASAQGI